MENKALFTGDWYNLFNNLEVCFLLNLLTLFPSSDVKAYDSKITAERQKTVLYCNCLKCHSSHRLLGCCCSEGYVCPLSEHPCYHIYLYQCSVHSL